MINNNRSNPWRLAGGTLVAALGFASTCTAWADDPNPYYVGVTQAFSHDSNVYRIPNAQGDNYWSTGLVGGVNQPFGRQRFYASGNVKYNRFQDLKSLDNTSYGLNAALDWATIERLSGTVSVSLNENLANYSSSFVTQQLTQKNIETSGQFTALARWGMVSLLTLESSYSHQELKYSADVYRVYNSKQDVLRAGVVYRPSGFLTLGAGLRTTRGDYPNQLFSNGDSQTFTRNDIDLTTTWIATGQSTVNGRLSFGRQKYAGVAQSSSSITSGYVNWAYKPTGKLAFNTSASRDTGLGSSFEMRGGLQTGAIGDNSRLSTGLAFNATYLATAKITVNSGLRYTHRSLSNALTAAGQQTATIRGSDNIRSVYLGATYAPTRNWLLACNLGRESRSVSDGSSLTLTYPYSANTATCSAQFTLQ